MDYYKIKKNLNLKYNKAPMNQNKQKNLLLHCKNKFNNN